MDITADSTHPEPTDSPQRGAPYRVPWGPRDVGIATLVFIGAFLLIPIPIVLPFAFGDTEARPAVLAGLVAGIVVYAAIAYIIYRTTIQKYRATLADLGIKRPAWTTLGWAALAFTGALIAGLAYNGIVQWFEIGILQQECADQIPGYLRNDALLLAITSAVAVILAPPIEESFFRGFAFSGLLRSWGLVPAVAVSGLMFGSAHLLGNPLLYKSLIQFALIGMIFALVYWKSGNLLSTVMAHFAFNLLGVIAIAATTCDNTGTIAFIRHWGFAA